MQLEAENSHCVDKNYPHEMYYIKPLAIVLNSYQNLLVPRGVRKIGFMHLILGPDPP